MDSIRVSEAPDTGSIPVEATSPERHKFLLLFRFFISLKPSAFCGILFNCDLWFCHCENDPLPAVTGL